MGRLDELHKEMYLAHKNARCDEYTGALGCPFCAANESCAEVRELGRYDPKQINKLFDELKAENTALREKVKHLEKPIACNNCGNTYEFVYIDEALEKGNGR